MSKFRANLQAAGNVSQIIQLFKGLSGMDQKQLEIEGIETLSQLQASELGIVDGLGKLSNKDIFREVNEQLLEYLKKGKLVYRKPWRDGVKVKGVTYGPQNYVTQSPYHGFNSFAIVMYNIFNQTNFQYFLTKKQIDDRGGKLKVGARGVVVAAYIKTEKERPHPKKKDEIITEVMSALIPYRVYPIEHTTGVKQIKRRTDKKEPDIDSILIEPQKIIDGMPKRPSIINQGDQAFYRRNDDVIYMPAKRAFHSMNEYYSTLFHELIHSTGHKKRIGRVFGTTKGDKNYAFEELIAELGASYLCGVSGIKYFTLQNSAAYLKGWASRLTAEIQNDKSFFFRAILGATKGAKYIIGETILDTESHKQKNLPEVKPDKTKKASVSQAIEDLIKHNPKMYQGKAMAMGMLYSSVKNNTMPDYNEAKGLKKSVFDKMADWQWVMLDEDSDSITTTSIGDKVVSSIEGRLNTLKAKKSGTDMFPDLSGVNKKAIHNMKSSELLLFKSFENLNNSTVSISVIKGLLKNATAIKGNTKLTGEIKTKLQKIIHLEKSAKNGNGRVKITISPDFMLKIENAIIILETKVTAKPVGEVFVLKPGAKRPKKLRQVTSPRMTFTDAKGKGAGSHHGGIKKKTKSLNGLVGASDITEVNYEELVLPPNLKRDFTRLYSDTKVMIWGSPGHGKTVKLLNYAQQFAEMGKKTLYIAHEELQRSTFKEKITEFKIGNPNLFFTRDLVQLSKAGKDIADFDIVFFDSVNSLGITLKQCKEIFEKYPDKLIFMIVQSTKDGDFRGGKEWEHEMDIAGEVVNRQLRLRKNRMDSGFIKKVQKLEEEDYKAKFLANQRRKSELKAVIKPELDTK